MKIEKSELEKIIARHFINMHIKIVCPECPTYQRTQKEYTKDLVDNIYSHIE